MALQSLTSNYHVFLSGKDFWLGLKNIYELTKMGRWTLRVTLTDADGAMGEAFYHNFRLKEPVMKWRCSCYVEAKLSTSLHADQLHTDVGEVRRPAPQIGQAKV